MGAAAASFERELGNAQTEQVKDVVEKYSMIPGGLIPALHEAQKILGFLPLWVQEYAAEKFELPFSEVCSVISHYSLFSCKERGGHQVGACSETTCCVKSTEEILRRIEKYLESEDGDAKDDRKYSIEIFKCAVECGSGLVMQITEKRPQLADHES